MRWISLLLLIVAVPALSSDPYLSMHVYAGEAHMHSGTLYTMAEQYDEIGNGACDTGDPRAAIEGALDCTCAAHSFGNPRDLYVEAFDAGMDWANISEHSAMIAVDVTLVDTFVAAVSGTYTELGSGDEWEFCEAGEGLSLSSGLCTHKAGDGVTEWDWLYDQASLAMSDRPGHLATVGAEYTVSATPPSEAAKEGGHKWYMSSIDDPVVNCSHVPNYDPTPDGRYYCKDEVAVYKMARENHLAMGAAHPCISASGMTYFGTVDYSTGGGFDPRAVFSHGAHPETNAPNCLDPDDVTTSNWDKNASYFRVLNAGYYLYPASDGDYHNNPAPDPVSTCSGSSSAIGSSGRTIVWAHDLSFQSIVSGMKARRAYWALSGKPTARFYGFDEPGGNTFSPDAIMGGVVTTSDDDITLSAIVQTGTATFTDMEVWHNGAEMIDVSDADITCSASTCTLAAHEFSSSVGGWWLLVVKSATHYEVVSAPIWVNRDPSGFRSGARILQDLVP